MFFQYPTAMNICHTTLGDFSISSFGILCEYFISVIIMFNYKILNNMSKLKGKVLAGKVLVKAQEAEVKTASGIIIPDSAKEKPLKGEVILVGSAKKDETVEVTAGDVVLYGKYAGTELNIDGVDYLLISHSDILYVV